MAFTYETTLVKNEDSSLMWYYMIPVPLEIAVQLKEVSKRVLCQINEGNTFHAALTPDGAGNDFVLVNKERRKQLKIDVGDNIKVNIETDHTKYGMTVPDVFPPMCEQDPEGSKLFHDLTPGKQRSLLHIMGKPKGEQKQLEKALIIFEHLKEVNGELDFKALNVAFKESRFKL
jgi:hypothetical protein